MRRALSTGVALAAVALVLLVAWWLWPTAPGRNGVGARSPSPLRAPDTASRAASRAPAVLPAGAEPESLEVPGLPEPAVVDAGALVAVGDVLRVHLKRPDGRPARRAMLALYSEAEQLVGEGVVDADGVWRHPGLDAGATLFVRGVTASVERFELERARGDHVLRLPDGLTLRGRVHLDGREPGAPFLLGLICEDLAELPWERMRGLRPAMFRLRGVPFAQFLRGIPTDAAGRFELSGLREGAKLEFHPPPLYRFDSQHGTPQPMTVDGAPVELFVSSPRMLRGRVVGEDGMPVPETELDVTSELFVEERDGIPREGGRNPWHRPAAIQLDANARFAVPLGDLESAMLDPLEWLVELQGGGAQLPEPREQPPHSQRIAPRALAPDGRWFDISRGLSDFDRDHDLGDLVLRPALEWRLRVVDTRGAPVAGALAYSRRDLVRDNSAPSFSADSDGVITVPQSRVRGLDLRVQADGYFARSVELPPEPAPEEILVTLTGNTRLRVLVHGPWDAPEVEAGWSFRYQLAGAEPILVNPEIGEDASSPEYVERWQRRLALHAEYAAKGYARFDPLLTTKGELSESSVRSKWIVEHVRPRHPLTLRVGLASVPYSQRPCPEAWIFEQDVTLEPGETREVHVDLSGWAAAR